MSIGIRFSLCGARMSNFLVFLCALQHRWWLLFEASVLCMYIKLLVVSHLAIFILATCLFVISYAFSDKGRISPEFEPVAH